LAQILRGGAARYVREHAGGGACPQVQSTLAKLSLCRTPGLGGRTYQCDDCGEVTEVFHSCGDRHCPQCAGRKRYDFAARAGQLILPGVTYYQVVFTLPSELSELALANRMAIADLLFAAAWKSLRKTIRTQQGYEPAAMMVLHTWNQRLQPHWHVHALVPGGGPSLSGNHWRTGEAPAEAPNSSGHYLVDAISLRESFRRYAIAHLKRLRQRGELKLAGKFSHLQEDAAWEAFCARLGSVDWVSFIQPPPTKTSSAAEVIRYLTRYLTGGPISDRRIVAADRREVTFLAREGLRTGGERAQVPVTLSRAEFIRLWCLHIQPDQLTKTRYFGGWCNQQRAKYLQRCRDLLGAAVSDPVVETTSSEETVLTDDASLTETHEEATPVRCPACEAGSLQLIRERAKPSWSDVLCHLDPRCPSWYAELGREEQRQYLLRTYGVDYEDWYLETRVESAKPPTTEPPPLQLYLPGMPPARDFWVESF
jgi:hypothetical protein